MNQIIYLRVDRGGGVAMTKNMPSLYRDEIIVKLNVKVDNKVFGNPTIEQEVVVSDWASDTDISGVDLEKVTITAAEAEMIRQNRIAQMQKVLEANGFKVTPKKTTDA